jgi:long-chain acyl-CoA synthetase
MNVADLVRNAARRQPAAPALVTTAGVLTWGELDARTDAAAAALRALDLAPTAGVPARVAVALAQSPEFAITLFGVLRAGLVAVPVNPGYTPRELRHVLADSGATVLVAAEPVVTAVEAVRADLPDVQHVFSAPPSSPVPRPLEAAGGGADLAVLLYTSGTSGAPKGAMLPHRALLANQRQIAAVDPPIIGPDDVVLLALPLFHSFGLGAGLLGVAYHGACGVLMDRFDPPQTLAAIAQHRVSVVVAVPQMYAAWLSQSAVPDDAVPQASPAFAPSLGTVRVAVSGGAPLPASVARQFRQATGLLVHQGYGLTETAPVLTAGLVSPVAKLGSIGRPLPGIDARLRAPDGTVVAEVTADGLRGGAVDDFDDEAGGAPGTDPGEIVVRGENLFTGYWPDGSGGPDADGWWPTGDVAYADEDGDLFLVDRLGELILVNGFNVYPQEVEQVLAAHPGVADAAVVGIADPVSGEAVYAYVVGSGASVDVDELRVYCGQNLARYKCPAAIEVVPELPYSVIGKVRKASLRANLEASR